jgi:hypothetical protein
VDERLRPYASLCGACVMGCVPSGKRVMANGKDVCIRQTTTTRERPDVADCERGSLSSQEVLRCLTTSAPGLQCHLQKR